MTKFLRNYVQISSKFFLISSSNVSAPGRFNDYTFSQERTLAGGVPNVHDLNAHRIYRTISCLKEFDQMGFRPRVQAVGPASLAYALAASHEAMSARPNAAARWPLKDVCEHLSPSGPYTGLPARTW
jgi:hypothetical protein